jgi:TFIIF-interacting CTD phosphatase-like protein
MRTAAYDRIEIISKRKDRYMNRKSTSPTDSDSKGMAKKTHPQGKKVTSISRESAEKKSPSDQDTKRRIGQLA